MADINLHFLQSMLRLRALQREVSVEDQQRTVIATLELDRLQTGSAVSFLRYHVPLATMITSPFLLVNLQVR